MSFHERMLEQHMDFEDIGFLFSRNLRIHPEKDSESCEMVTPYTKNMIFKIQIILLVADLKLTCANFKIVCRRSIIFIVPFESH